jgi:uncharacterized protein YkwD
MRIAIYLLTAVTFALYFLFGALVLYSQETVQETGLPAKTAGVLTIGYADTGISPDAGADAGIVVDPYSFLTEQERRFFEILNRYRAELGCAALIPDVNLTKGSRHWAANGGYYHASSGYNGECLAPNGSADGAFNAWLKSEGHRRIMARAEYKYGGVGFARSRAVFRASYEPWPKAIVNKAAVNKPSNKQYSKSRSKSRSKLFPRLFQR